MRLLREQNPGYVFKFVIGEDLILGIQEWSDPECPTHDAGVQLYNREQFLVINRPGYHREDPNLPPNFEIISPFHSGTNIVAVFLSSSEVRNRINLEKSRQLKSADDEIRDRMLQASRTFSDDNLDSTPSIPEPEPWYSEGEGLVPAAVLAHIVRYRLYC
eukprot:c9288_g1_i2.p1 GENE.c9288_g1_i2~~c9288_g1_i2.p1  ORF type:complete len:160 (-),score=44.82 c9288_g1_i2:118-597(-)